MKTLSVIFDRDLGAVSMVQEREAEAVAMVRAYLQRPAAAGPFGPLREEASAPR